MSGGFVPPTRGAPMVASAAALSLPPFATGAILERAEKYQRLAQTKGLPRDSH